MLWILTVGSLPVLVMVFILFMLKYEYVVDRVKINTVSILDDAVIVNSYIRCECRAKIGELIVLCSGHDKWMEHDDYYMRTMCISSVVEAIMYVVAVVMLIIAFNITSVWFVLLSLAMFTACITVTSVIVVSIYENARLGGCTRIDSVSKYIRTGRNLTYQVEIGGEHSVYTLGDMVDTSSSNLYARENAALRVILISCFIIYTMLYGVWGVCMIIA